MHFSLFLFLIDENHVDVVKRQTIKFNILQNMIKLNKYFNLLLLGIIIISCKTNSPSIKLEEKKTGFISDSAMVVSARKEASEIGKEIMRKGGNAFDAMIATDLALAVAYPFAGNIGGGGFMVYRTADGQFGSLDYREKAPMMATRDMYLDSLGNVIPDLSTLGAKAVGVPGTIAGLYEIHRRFGSIPFAELIQPAIELATKGIQLTQGDVNSFSHARKLFRKANNYAIPFDHEWKKGDTLKFPKLAVTLERIRDNGRAEFYGGKTGKDMIDYIRKMGGIMTMEDLENYQAVWRKPIVFSYKNYKITSMTLPSSGGICIAQILKSIEPFHINQYKHNSTEYIQLLTEAERRAFADRAYFLGDTDFVKVPINQMIDPTYLTKRMSSFNWKKASLSSEVSHGDINFTESNETTHYSIVDPMGNAIAVTTTLNGAFGSKVYADKGGFFLNNEMDDFSIKPGVANMFGLVGTEANAIKPEKRMLSSMSPTIVEQNGKLKMVLGSPGGSHIITSVLQNILNVTEYGMSMQESVSKPRFHHQWLPDEIKMERNGFDSITIQKLKELGYKISINQSVIIGKVDAILVLPNGKLEGGADPRGDDKAAGF